MTPKRVTKVTAALSSLNKSDIYSLMLFTLYKMQDIPDYLTLSELSYILDGNNLTKFLGYFGGMTIKIPTLRDLRLVMQALLLYQYVNMQDMNFEEALKKVSGSEFSKDEVKELYSKILEVMENYDFQR